MSSIAAEITGTVQSAHIRHNPDPRLDLAPETAADKKELVTLHGPDSEDELDDDDEDDIAYSVIRPAPKAYNLPPLPDLRFEQSYLKSISAADTWWKVAVITTRDQVFMPLVQGLAYNILLCGWQQWNRNAQLHGSSVGARVRRWWWDVNNWTIPNPQRRR